MPESLASSAQPIGGFPIQGRMMNYKLFVPRLYNWCKSLGFESGKIMPSRAFCADENQGYPIIMLTKHFGTFPFNHGISGGVVATSRHEPHAAHGQDLVIIQASHVGYDPANKEFGTYRRAQTREGECSASCGKVHHVLAWYQNEYRFAQQNILVHNDNNKKIIIVDNQLLREDRDEGLLLHLDKLIAANYGGQRIPLKVLSTATVFTPSQDFIDRIGDAAFYADTPEPIGANLLADMFFYRRKKQKIEWGYDYLEQNMIRYMPQIITSSSPILAAAQVNTRIEFDRTFRTIVKEQSYYEKRLLFIGGLNIDISPQSDQMFPLTMYVPWAAYAQERNGLYNTMEQDEVVHTLKQQSTDNPDQINLEEAIQLMESAEEIEIDI